MIKKYLIFKTTVYISAMTVDCAQVDIHQICRTVDIEGSCGDLIMRIIRLFLILIARARYYEEHVILADFPLYLCFKMRQRAVQRQIIFFCRFAVRS